MEKLMNNLKKQILEANKIEESLEKSLEEKQITVERMEAEIVHLKKELDAKIIQTKSENSSKILDKIITVQRDSGNKNGIGYSQKESHVNSKSYADALHSTFKKINEEKISNDQNSRRLPPPIRKEGKTIPKKFYQNRYPRIFPSYCFACSNFGHKAINCRAYRKKKLKNQEAISKNKDEDNDETFDIELEEVEENEKEREEDDMDTSESEEDSEDGYIREEFPIRDTKTPSRIIQQNHPEELIIGDMNDGVQTRRKLLYQT
jgi:hypothetical protein